MSVNSVHDSSSTSNRAALWGAAAGLALFGGVAAAAVLLNRFSPSDLSRSSVKLLTSPLSGG